MVNFDARSVFIRIPKTAGTSVSEALRSHWFGSNLTRGHGKVHRIAREAAIHLPWHEFRSFAFVRNPWDRMVSLWAFISQEKGVTFEQFVRCPSDLELPFIRPQTDYLLDDSGQCMVSVVGRFENLIDDFAQICPGVTLRHLNKSSHAPYRTYYTPELVALVEDRYQRDIAMFGYKF